MGNNPVSFVDPDGEFVIGVALLGILKAAGIGAAIGAAGYTASVGFSEGGFNNWSWGGLGTSMAMGAVSGALTAGIGSMMSSVGSHGFAGEIGRAMMHGQANMMVGAAFGQNPSFAGYASGALGSLSGSALHGAGAAAQIAGSALTGGIGAELAGGDFWRGAATGATVASLNHVAHGFVHRRQVNLQVRAARAFLEDLGYSSSHVSNDVVAQKDNFFGKYYARLNNFSRYEGSFTGGYLDSYSMTSDAYLSKVRNYKYKFITPRNTIGEGQTGYALKYYPSRAHSIGITMVGIDHYFEATFEFMDGIARSVSGYDNLIYDMHGRNALFYLNNRRYFR